MKVRCVKSAFVSAALLAAIAMSCGTANANSPSSGTDMVRAAYSTLKQGDARTAIGQFTQALNSGALEPEVKANALLNRALAQQQVGNHQAAIADYSAALALDVMAQSLRATALYNRGLSNYKLQQLQPAIEDYTSSLLLNPKSAFAFYGRGNALRDSGQYLFALSDYDRALRYGHPDKPRVLLASANTYLALNRPNDAKKALNAALAANPNFGEARAQLILLGDQNAKAETQASDPVVTGSIAAIAGGTVVTKPELPAPVTPPKALLKERATAKLIVDRVPVTESPLALAASKAEQPITEEVVEVEHIPEVPVPGDGIATDGGKAKTKAKAKAKTKPAVEVTETASAEAPAVEETAQATAADEPAVEPDTAAQPNLGAWSVQVASAASEDAAWSTWKKMQSRSKVLQSKKPVVVRADLGAKGIVYRVRLGGFETQKSAAKECSALKANGVGCYISKTDG